MDSDYVCPQCGPDKDGPEAHARNFHTFRTDDDDEWAQLASDCGLTPDCDTREEFVKLMRQVVEQAARATPAPAPVTVSDEMVERVIAEYVGERWDGYGSGLKHAMRQKMRAALEAYESARGPADAIKTCANCDREATGDNTLCDKCACPSCGMLNPTKRMCTQPCQ